MSTEERDYALGSAHGKLYVELKEAREALQVALGEVTRLQETCGKFKAQIATLTTERDRLQREVLSEREARMKLDAALRAKDHAMSVLMDLCQRRGIDLSEFIP